MRIPITPVSFHGAVCTEAEVSIAISNSVAIRAVPVDVDGNEYPDYALPVVGDAEQADIAAFMATVATAAQELLAGRA